MGCGIKEFFRYSLDALLDLLFCTQKQCVLCGQKEAVGEMGVCEACKENLALHEEPKCKVCGRSCDSGLCVNCKRMEMAFDGGDVVFIYEGGIRDRLLELKNEGGRKYAGFFVKWMIRQLKSNGWPKINVVTAVPTFSLRRLSRGYNPPELLAKGIATKLGLRCQSKLLNRVQHSGHMSDKNVEERLQQAKNNFIAGEEILEGETVLLIDDITTTGATLHVCAQRLKQMGAGKVYVLAAAGGRMDPSLG